MENIVRGEFPASLTKNGVVWAIEAQSIQPMGNLDPMVELEGVLDALKVPFQSFADVLVLGDDDVERDEGDGRVTLTVGSSAKEWAKALSVTEYGFTTKSFGRALCAHGFKTREDRDRALAEYPPEDISWTWEELELFPHNLPLETRQKIWG